MKTKELPNRTTANGFNLRVILVPVDFSPLSQKALHYAQRFAIEFGAELRLLHILEARTPATLEGIMVAHSNGNFADAKKRLTAMANSARVAGVDRVDSSVRRGLAWHAILEAAEELDVDLVIIATHGYTGWKHLCIGSTAERVVRGAPCPVLVVREKEHEFVSTTIYGDA